MKEWLLSHPLGQFVVSFGAGVVSTYVIDVLRPRPALWTKFVIFVASAFAILLIPSSAWSALAKSWVQTYAVKGWVLTAWTIVTCSLTAMVCYLLARQRSATHDTAPPPAAAPVSASLENDIQPLGQADLEILKEFGSRFPGRLVFRFLDDLREDRSIDLDTVAKLDANMKRYSAHDKSFSDRGFNRAREQFFAALNELLDFADTKFEPAGGGRRVFKSSQRSDLHGSTRLRDQYLADEVELGRLTAEVDAAWGGFVTAVRGAVPDFQWPD